MTSVGLTELMHWRGKKKAEFQSARKQEIKPYWPAAEEVKTGLGLLVWNANIQDLHKNVLDLTTTHKQQKKKTSLFTCHKY